MGPLNFQGETHIDPVSKANVLANYFSSVFTNENISHIPCMEGDPLPSIDTIQVHSEGVAELLSNIDSSKAYGPDNLPARFLKEVSSEIASVLTLIFQASLDQGSLPEVWKQATVVPVFKKGSRTDPCICAKILEILFILMYLSTYKNMQYYVMHSMASVQIEAVTPN